MRALEACFFAVVLCTLPQSGFSNSSKTISFKITSRSGPIAPAAAVAGCRPSNRGSLTNGSCFNTLAFNIDFTGATQSQLNGNTFNQAILSNWLDCAGAVNPILWSGGFNAPAPPCSVYSIVNDGGTNALRMTFTPSMTRSNFAELATATNVNGHFKGTAFPGEYYVEARLRTDSGSDAACSNGVPCQDFWSYTAGQGGGLAVEWDFIEMYNTQKDSGGSNVGASRYAESHSINSSVVSAYNHDTYNIIGERVTQDGTGKISICNYVNNIQIPNDHRTLPSNCIIRNDTSWVGNYSTPITILLQSGSGGHSFSRGRINLYVQWMRIWSCRGWTNATPPNPSNNNGQACAGVVLATNP